MTFLLGRQAMFGHDPPMYLRSTTATRFPSPANVQAAMVDPVPPPRITRSNSSGWVFVNTLADELLLVLCMPILLFLLLRMNDFSRGIELPVARGERCSECCWRGGVWHSKERRRSERAGKSQRRPTCPMPEQ